MAASSKKRWTGTEKREVVVRLLRGEPIEAVSEDVGVPVRELEKWRKNGLAAMDVRLQPYRFGCGELVVVVVILIIMAAIVDPGYGHRPGGGIMARRAVCEWQLTNIGRAFEAYAEADPAGSYPLLSREPGRLMINPALFPIAEDDEAVPSDPSIFVCIANDNAPEDYNDLEVDELVDDHSYWYPGYALLDEGTVAWFQRLYPQALEDDIPPRLFLPEGETLTLIGYPQIPIQQSSTPGNAGRIQVSNALVRLGKHAETQLLNWPAEIDPGEAEAFLATLRSRIPVIIERPGHHVPPGGHVLYLDGRVEYVREGTWPMTPATIETLRALADN